MTILPLLLALAAPAPGSLVVMPPLADGGAPDSAWIGELVSDVLPQSLQRAGVAAVAFWTAVFACWSWVRRPAQSVIETRIRADAEMRRLPFLVKPFERPDVQPGPRIARRSRMSPVKYKPVPLEEKDVDVFLGGITMEEESR